MNECSTNRNTDLLGTRWSWLLWKLPYLLILIGLFTSEMARAILWSVGFTAAGISCLVNAYRCGRLHCFVTGPLFLAIATASLLYGLHVLSRGNWNWILGIAFGGVLFARLLEVLLGKYTRQGSTPF